MLPGGRRGAGGSRLRRVLDLVLLISVVADERG
jgi:hypothetical protein